MLYLNFPNFIAINLTSQLIGISLHSPCHLHSISLLSQRLSRIVRFVFNPIISATKKSLNLQVHAPTFSLIFKQKNLLLPMSLIDLTLTVEYNIFTPKKSHNDRYRQSKKTTNKTLYINTIKNKQRKYKLKKQENIWI